MSKKCRVENCDCVPDKGRRYCHKHLLERKAQQRLIRKSQGLKVRTTYECICEICGESFISFRKPNPEKYTSGRFCQSCQKKIKKFGNNTNNNYTYIKKGFRDYKWEHRMIVENVLKRKLNTNEVIHHLDGNPKNNVLTNLIVLSRSNHNRLHKFLAIKGVILQECENENAENCWDNLIVPMTTTWLETAGVKVIKIWEIGQSAAEPL